MKRLVLTMSVLAMSLCGCRKENMADQPRFNPLEPSSVFADGMSARPLVEGTVMRDGTRSDAYLYVPPPEAKTFPANFPSSGDALRLKLERGRERFNIYCSVCHGALGDGNGMIAQRGFIRPPSFHLDRLRQAAPGHFYNVMTYGFGAMYSYAARVSPDDRWAIVAYIRALQMSQGALAADLTAQEQAQLQQAPEEVPATMPVDTGTSPTDNAGITIK